MKSFEKDEVDVLFSLLSLVISIHLSLSLCVNPSLDTSVGQLMR